MAAVTKLFESLNHRSFSTLRKIQIAVMDYLEIPRPILPICRVQRKTLPNPTEPFRNPSEILPTPTLPIVGFPSLGFRWLLWTSFGQTWIWHGAPRRKKSRRGDKTGLQTGKPSARGRSLSTAQHSTAHHVLGLWFQRLLRKICYIRSQRQQQWYHNAS